MHAVPFINKQIGLIKKVGLFMFTFFFFFWFNIHVYLPRSVEHVHANNSENQTLQN